MSGYDTKKRLTTVVSGMQKLHRRLLFLLGKLHISPLIYQRCCKRLNQGKKHFIAGFRIFDDETHFNCAGMHPAVDLKWLSRLVLIQTNTVSFLGGKWFLHIVNTVQRTI
jgi:hypothetical protein